MRTVLAVLAVLISGSCCSVSAAQPPHVFFDAWAVSEEAAYATWGAPWCGRATFTQVPDEQLGGAVAYAIPIECRVVYGSAALRMTPGELCPLIVHEVAHIHGIGHSDPAPVMRQGWVDFLEVPECASRIRVRYMAVPYWQPWHGKRRHARCVEVWTDARVDTSTSTRGECDDGPDNMGADFLPPAPKPKRRPKGR